MVAIGRVLVLAAGVAGAGGDHPVALAKQLLHSPETAPGEDRSLGVVPHRASPLDVRSQPTHGNLAELRLAPWCGRSTSPSRPTSRFAAAACWAPAARTRSNARENVLNGYQYVRGVRLSGRPNPTRSASGLPRITGNHIGAHGGSTPRRWGDSG